MVVRYNYAYHEKTPLAPRVDHGMQRS